MTLSNREKVLLSALAILVIFGGLIRFGISPLQAKLGEMTTEIENLESQKIGIQTEVMANANIEKSIANAEQKMLDNGYLKEDTTDVELDALFQKMLKESGLSIIETNIADAQVTVTENFKVSKPVLIYPIRSARAAIDDGTNQRLQKEMQNADGSSIEGAGGNMAQDNGTADEAAATGDEATADDTATDETATEQDNSAATSAATAAAATDNGGATQSNGKEENPENALPLIRDELHVRGTFEQVVNFIDEISKLHRSIIVTSLQSGGKTEEDGNEIDFTIVLDTYFTNS